MKQLENLSILIVIPDLQSKTKLREVLKTFVYRGDLHYDRGLTGLGEALISPTAHKYDLIFIAAKLGTAPISKFLAEMAIIPESRAPSVVIALGGGSEHSSVSVATWYMEGVAGFISEPYTSDNLIQLMTTIIEQRNSGAKRPSNKARKAAEFLFSDAMALLDEVARLRFEGKEGGYALRDLKSLGKTFAEFEKQDSAAYEEALIETFSKAKAPAWTKSASRSKAKVREIKHPGQVIKELMTLRSLQEDRLVSLLRMDIEAINALTQGLLKVDDALAQNLSRVFGMSSREWLKMQKDFDTFKAKNS